MATVTSTVLAISAVVGAGVSVYSANQQAKASEQSAAYNAAIQRQNASRQRYQAEQQALQDQAIAENQMAFQKYQTQINQNNAIALAQQAEATDKAARENIRRARDEKKKRLGFIRASGAAGGLNVGEGTVVETLAETSEILELDILDISRNAQAEVNNLYYQSQLEEAGASRSMAERDIMQLRADNAKFNYSSGRYIEMFGKQQANMTLLAGRNAGSTIRSQGYASAISSLGSAASTYSTNKDLGVTRN